MTQVAGRGREEREVLIQTFDEENDIFNKVKIMISKVLLNSKQ